MRTGRPDKVVWDESWKLAVWNKGWLKSDGQQRGSGKVISHLEGKSKSF